MQSGLEQSRTGLRGVPRPERATPVATYYHQECPVCSRKLQIRIEHLGERVACQHCRSQFVATDPALAGHDGHSNLDKADQLLALCSGNSAALRERVLRYLQILDVDGLEDVEVEVNCGVVILRGLIASPHDRWLCRNSAERVAGVLRVIDELEIRNGVPIGNRRPR